jgi:hypothetical protein
VQTIDTSVQTTSHFVRALPFRKQLLKRRCEISHSLRFLEWYYLSGISVNRTETQRRHGCQANATPAQWCDAPGRRLVPISSKSVHHNPRLCAVANCYDDVNQYYSGRPQIIDTTSHAVALHALGTPPRHPPGYRIPFS